MAQVWLMKAYRNWADSFKADDVVGIDEEGFDVPYNTLTEAQALAILEKHLPAGKRKGQRIRFFNDFVYRVNPGDWVILGIGQTAKFNVVAIAKVLQDEAGAYRFDTSRGNDQHPVRHVRSVKMTIPDEPIPFDKWGWANRIELLPNERMGELAEMLSAVLFD